MDFVVNRDDLRQCRFVAGVGQTIGPEEVVLRIERFALTANNVTYGAVGDLVGYWKFFPAEAGWGRIPVWGIATVEVAGTSGLRAGERIYGYFPMSERLAVLPARVTEHDFVDARPHRRDLPPVYNQYVRLESEPGYARQEEDRTMLLRPLFATAFLLDDFLAESAFFGASSVLLASASSKTAFSLAFLLARNRGSACEVVGLTSAGNVDFVRGLGCYDRVIAYQDIPSMPADRPIVLVDMAGSQRVTRDVHERFGTAVKYSCQVGLTHWEQRGSVADLPGAKPEFFFAPSQGEKRTRDWGAAGFQARLASAWRSFLDGTEGWLRISHARGPAAVERAYRDTLDGRVKPNVGLILSLQEEPGS